MYSTQKDRRNYLLVEYRQ